MNPITSVISLRSVTEANKAKRQLANYGVKCTVEKIHARRNGCVYGIRVQGDTEKICRLLLTVNIDCQEISTPKQGGTQPWNQT